jgi:beta-galactosidase
MLAWGDEPLAVKALPWTNRDLAAATHPPDLGPGLTTVLSLDHRVAGLGSSVCGPKPLERYLVPPERFRFTVHLRAVPAG